MRWSRSIGLMTGVMLLTSLFSTLSAADTKLNHKVQLAAPSGVSALADSNSAVINFNPVDFALSYTVRVYVGMSKKIFGKLHRNWVSGTRITGLRASQQYRITVQAIGDGSNYSSSSESGKIAVKTTAAIFQYSITFDSGTADSGFLPTESGTASSVTLSLFSTGNMVNAGYHFTGWLGDDGKKYRDGQVISLPGTFRHTLTAHWLANNNSGSEKTATAAVSYSITFDSGTADSGFLPTESGTASSVTLSLFSTGNMVKAGYHFTGWLGDNATSYSDGQVISLPGTFRHTLTAQWAINTYSYSITFDSGTADSGFLPTESGTASSVTLSLFSTGNMVKAGYHFTGWLGDNATSYSDGQVISLPGTFTHTLTAQWAKYAFTSTHAPSFSGSPSMNLPFTASLSPWSPAASFSYQWQKSADGVSNWLNTGVNSLSYTPTAGETSTYLRLQVVGTANGYTTETQTSVVSDKVGYLFSKRDFTVETWVKPTTGFKTTGRNEIFSLYNGFPWTARFDIWYGNTPNTWGVYDSNYGERTFSAPDVALDTWHHIVVARHEGVIHIFYDGVEVYSFSDDSDFSVANKLSLGSDCYWFGTNDAPRNWAHAKIAYVRVVNGFDLYLNNFTPSIDPPASVPGTTFLLSSVISPASDTTLEASPNSFFDMLIGRDAVLRRGGAAPLTSTDVPVPLG